MSPADPASPLHPRKFGLPGGIGVTRGWYFWRKFDAATWTAEVEHEATGEINTVKVLPWATTYRHMVYGAHVDELLPGERVNLFFNPDGDKRRGYLVHYQDELCQMKGHGHAWVLREVAADGRHFTAQVFAGEKVFEEKPREFELATDASHWRGGQRVNDAKLSPAERLYFTWTKRAERRVVTLTSDDASLDAVKKEEMARVSARLEREGLAGFVESVADGKANLVIFSTYWFQANQWKPGQTVKVFASKNSAEPVGTGVEAELLTRKNLGTYGSGATDAVLRLRNIADSPRMQSWTGGQVVRVKAE